MKKYRNGIIGMLLLVFLDQLTKYFAIHILKPQGSASLIPQVFAFYYLENHGAAWGILQNAQVLFLLITVLLLAVLVYYYRKLPDERHWRAARILMIVLASGAAGNAIDRIRLGYVVDFLYFSLIDFPIFNVADCYVTVSIFLGLLIYRKEVWRWMKSDS